MKSKHICSVTVVFYDASGEKKTVSVKEACMFAHNLVREHHKETPDLKWDDNLANEVITNALSNCGGNDNFLRC